MASGTITFTASGYLQGKVEWSSTSNGSTANTSSVTGTLYARRTNNATTTGQSWSGNVTVNGSSQAISFSSSVSVSNNWVQMATKTVTVSHNDDGTKQITISGTVTGPSGTSLSGNTSSGSQTVTLDTIPRYAQIASWDVGAVSETSIRFAYSLNGVCDYAWYSLDNGANWIGVDIQDGEVGVFTVSNLSANTTYNCKLRVRRKDSQLITTSDNSKSVKTYSYPYCSNSPDFIIGNALNLTIYNPLNRQFRIIVYGSEQGSSNWTTIYDGDGWSGTNVGDFTSQSIVNKFYESIPTKQSGKYHVKIRYNNHDEDKTNAGTFSIRGNEVPTFSNFTYTDTNTTTTNLTGNNQILVNGYSNVQVSISTSNKATAKNSAIMKTYSATIGNQSSSANYSASSNVNLPIIQKTTSGTIKVSATDSRNLSTTVTKNATIKNYSPIVIKSVTATRANSGVSQEVILAFNGTFWNDNFGSTTNDIINLQYWYRVVGTSAWTLGDTTLTVTKSGNNWTGSASIRGDLQGAGFDISNSYDIWFRINDRLSQGDRSIVLTSGTPGISIYKNKVAIGQKYDPSLGGILQIDGKKYEDFFTYTQTTGIYTTAVWGDGTTNCIWTAPRTGLYLIIARFINDNSSNAKIYKQLQLKGTATRITGDVIFWQDGPGESSSSDSPNQTIKLYQGCALIFATQGQTIYPRIYTSEAGIEWIVDLTGLFLK